MMKSKIIFILTILMILLSSTCVFAENIITLSGQDTIEPGKTGTIIVKLASEKEIGVISGRITGKNVSDIKITCKNDWTMPAGDINHETGAFSILKAEGAKNEEVMEISYKASNEEGQASITLNDLRITNISYEDKDLGNITKQISIKDNTVQPEEPEEPEQPEQPEQPIKPEEPAKSDKSDVSMKSKPTVLPNAGNRQVILPIAITILLIVIMITFLIYKRYREIK